MTRQLLLLPLLGVLLLIAADSRSQCNTLRPQIDITFNTDQDCAPTTVTDFTIKYFFNVPQNPADIVIRFEWNDPTNAVDNVGMGTGLVVTAGNTEFEATGTFLYPANNDCSFLPTAYIVIAGGVCPTSEQEQTAFSWARDNEFGGMLAINPMNYDVCHGDTVNNAIFMDASNFNCNIVVEPDNPNRQMRHVQFVYGTNHNPAASIRDLTLNDGGIQTLTDNTGALAMTATRGTIGLMVTAAYFGPVEAIPFPADNPISNTFPMNAPANVANLVGDQFEVTMYNWNICNPYNGDPVNPNYDEAISETAYIRIVDAPAPSFQTRRDNAAGFITTDFCIGDQIYFDNLTAGGGLNYFWEFFDDAVGTPPALGTSTAGTPTFIYNTPGQKLIRLSATNPTAQAGCTRTFDLLVNITPTMIADIRTTDLSDMDIIPHFCQDATLSQTFDVRFHDNATGTPIASSQWRWEFYDETNALIAEFPAAGAFSSTALGPFDRTFTTLGNYLTRYITRDALTACEVIDSVYVRVYNDPVAVFTVDRVCEGVDTHFEENSTLMPINGESIVSIEWDFDYDGVTFTKDAAFDNMRSFDRNLGTSGTYDVALRVVTDQNACENILVIPTTVDPLPTNTFTIDQDEGCSVLPIEITNTSVGTQPTLVSQYIWQVDNRDGFGFIDLLIQDPSDPGFLAVFTQNFTNTTLVNDTVDLRLRVVNQFTCESISPSQEIVIFPAPESGFAPLNYDPFANNCGSVTVDFEVDALTQGLMPTSYVWEVTDPMGAISTVNTTPPNHQFNFTFDNTSTTDVADFDVRLTTDFPGGCPADSVRTIRVNPIPSSVFSVDTLLFDCENMTLFMDAQQKGLNTYFWEIVVNSTAPAVVSSTSLGDRFDYNFTRPAPGSPNLNVDISLQTTNFANCQSTVEVFSLVIPAQDNINAGFTATPTVQTLPNRLVTLNNTTNGGSWSYLWDFGDGQTSTNPNEPFHEYTTFGDYTIVLTVSSQFCTEVVSQMITINPIPPIVDFDYNPASGCAPLTVEFTNLSQFADADSYVWDLGDTGATTTNANPVYTYTKPGIYTVSLTASNSVGDVVQEVKQQIIEVFDSPIAVFDIRPPILKLPELLYTKNTSFGATSYLWDFGDGNTSTDFEPTHEYEDINTDDFGNEIGYNIRLIAFNEQGCTDTSFVQNAVLVKRSEEVLLPNAFSPSLIGPSSDGSVSDGDFTNDVFLPKMNLQRVTSFRMLIFNKWGELLFESRNKEKGWDGYYQGRLVPQDVYVYRLNLEYEDGESETLVGDITLIR